MNVSVLASRALIRRPAKKVDEQGDEKVHDIIKAIQIVR